jgi:hypothetical protein
MRKIAGVLFSILIFTACLTAQTAEPRATMAAHPKQIEQTGTVIFTVKLSPKPNVSGTVRVLAAPDGNGQGEIVATGGVGEDGTAEASAVLRINAALGKWKVAWAKFQPTASDEVLLSFTGNRLK